VRNTEYRIQKRKKRREKIEQKIAKETKNKKKIEDATSQK